MGRYNWELFVLCGFGWFADKYVTHSVREARHILSKALLVQNFRQDVSLSVNCCYISGEFPLTIA